jgi:restriction system protein
MGKVNFSTRAFYDSTTEYIGVKSGLLLGRFQIRDILLKHFENNFLINDDLKRFIRLYADELDDMFLKIRQAIGNLPLTSPIEKDYDKIRDYVQRTQDIESLARSTSICGRYIQENPNISNIELAEILVEKENYPKEISLSIANIGIERIDQSCVLHPNSKSWNGQTSLSDLFDCEIIGENENEFLEQKFLDYLAVNGHEIENIHWRNFERFCAEYFHKLGQYVVLGPGTNDGGIDIRVFNTEDTKKPLILIQCKRYKKENKVSIETVKSFYSDVLFEEAQKGLIATSSYIASGGKKVRDVRGYNIDFAEYNNVKNWAKDMWKHK